MPCFVDGKVGARGGRRRNRRGRGGRGRRGARRGGGVTVHAEGRLGGEGGVEGSMLEKREESTATWRAEKGMRGGWNEEEEATKKWKGVMERERLWLELLLKARKGVEG